MLDASRSRGGKCFAKKHRKRGTDFRSRQVGNNGNEAKIVDFPDGLEKVDGDGFLVRFVECVVGRVLVFLV